MRRGSVGTSVGVVVAAVLTLLGAAGASQAREGEADYGVSLEEDHLAGDVGETVTVRPRVYENGSGKRVAEGAPVGGGLKLAYELPLGTSPVGLDGHRSCRTARSEYAQVIVRCDTVAPLTIRVDKALVDGPGTVDFFPPLGPNTGTPQDNYASFYVTAPAPREEGETGASRERREGVGFTLLGVAGGFAVLAVFLLVRGRARRTGWASVVVGAVCAGLGAWSITQGPLTGSKTYVTYPSGPAVLDTGQEGDTIWDTGLVVEDDRPAYAPTIATAPDPGNETATEVHVFYSSEMAGAPKEGWLTVDGAKGRIKDPRRARNHMLETAAGAPGVEVLQKPRLILANGGPDQKTPVLFRCQELRLPDLPAEDPTVSMCAWADRGVRALVTVADADLNRAAHLTRQLRDAIQFGNKG
ncbi:hypothetical protein [Streptomyces sp. 4F14]|uniref:hypothetical protein n=1 Tax=Streptomyces sp. 4F14 TaxID=3394380 RepID=UPI003A89ECD6